MTDCQVLKPGVEDLLGVDLQFLEMSAKILQFIDPSLERTSLVDILGTLICGFYIVKSTTASCLPTETLCLHVMSLWQHLPSCTCRRHPPQHDAGVRLHIRGSQHCHIQQLSRPE
jgi:hypothetical protein